MSTTKITPFKLKPHSASARILVWIGDCDEKSKIFGLEIPKRNKNDFWHNLSYLKDRGFIKYTVNNPKVKFRLTDKGLIEYLKLKVIRTSPLEDDLVCLVVFDIPERLKKQRNILRKFLKDCDFNRLQKSVWVTKFDVGDLLTDLFKRMGVEKWIKIFICKEKSC